MKQLLLVLLAVYLTAGMSARDARFVKLRLLLLTWLVMLGAVTFAIEP